MTRKSNYMKAFIECKRFSPIPLLVIFFFVVLSINLPSSYAATITVVNLDGPGEGFNDPTPWTPTGWNPATTLGQARLNAFQHAADLLADYLLSDVEIFVDANLDPIAPPSYPACTPTSGVLGSAGPNFVFRDFSGAPVANTWYVQALANSLRGIDLSPANDISATFNSNVDNQTCLGSTDWYYGYDANGGGDIDFVSVVLHELTHGLGFLSLVNLNTGAKLGGPIFGYFDDAYMRHLEHHGAVPPDYPS